MGEYWENEEIKDKMQTKIISLLEIFSKGMESSTTQDILFAGIT